MNVPSRELTASDVLARWYAAWNAHGADAVSALMTDDIRYEDGAALPDLRGRRAVEDHVRAWFRGFPDLHLEKIEEWVTPGGTVIASYFRFTGTLTGTFHPWGRMPLTPTNHRVECLGMDRSELRDGKLARHQIFSDTVSVGRQLGFFPPLESAMDRLGFRLQHLTARRMRRRS